MADTLIVVSDLHLGRGTNQDDFRQENGAFRDEEFLDFCRGVAGEARDSRVTLVLNGDVIDFWEIAADEELAGGDPVAAIRRNLVFPAATAEARRKATDFCRWQLEQALDRHRGFTAGLREVLGEGRARVVYLFGNHDHAMVNPALQDHLRELLADGAGGGLADPGRLDFGFFHEDRELKAYVEHGNQFAGAESSFADPEDWTREAPGYYPLRFAWNRYQETFNVVQPTVVDKLSFLVGLIRRRLEGKTRFTMQCFIDYFRACDEGLVPEMVRNFGIDVIHGCWESEGKPAVVDDFLVRKAAEELDRKDVPAPAELAPGSGFGPAPQVRRGWPGEDVHPEKRWDGYTEGLIRRFTRDAAAPFPRLDRGAHVKTFLGHTHQPRMQPLFQDQGISVQRYFNVGTWTRELRFAHFGFVKGRDHDGQLKELR